MPYNGSGIYTTTNPPPFVFNTTISEAQMNACLADIANALSAVVVRDGQGAMTGPLNMGSQVITNIAAGTAAAPSVRFTAGNGLYMPAADQVGIAIVGANAATFSATGESVVGQVVSTRNTQTAYGSGALLAQSSDGDVHVGLHAAGATAASLAHIRGSQGLSSRDATGSAYAPFTGSTGSFGTTGTQWQIGNGNNWLQNVGYTQPSFGAIQSAERTTAGVYTTYAEVHDVAGGFNPSAGIFTCPVTGRYLFTWIVYCIHGAGSSILEVSLNTTYTVGCRAFYSVCQNISNTRLSAGGAYVVYGSAGEQVYLNCAEATSITHSSIMSFSGALLF